MPFLETDDGRAYYRHWAALNPRAAVIFLHGFGEHTGLYHRYGFALNAAGVDLWAVDQFGHGLTPGERGDFTTLEASIGLADRLAELAEAERPGTPLVAQGHSFGAVATLWKLLANPAPYRAAVVSGAPLVPVPGLVDVDSTFEIAPSQLSADPFYLDAIENDPLAFVDADGGPWRVSWTGAGTPSARPCPPWRCPRSRCTAATIPSRRWVRCGPTPSRSSHCRSSRSTVAGTTSSTT
ncbi:lysophospholipase [Mycolicibacterium hodleri]|uniref:lysophospholipase n=1 Tax=Mycolicibacterium hodleri TaxID=49897 RepID=UPI0021F28946|nr:lysophospholipase [Mycolicibacterium hodleri]